MSQQEIINFLKKNKNKWFSTREISEKIALGRSNTCKGLARLKWDRLVLFESRVGNHGNEFFYRYNEKND